MHYCQACDAQRPMEPQGSQARCPLCGRTEPLAARRPLVVVVGASGSGKTAIFPGLVALLAGRAAVFDVDWLIDPLARQGHVDWPTFRDLWLHVAHGVAQNGLATVLMAPFLPDQLEELPGRRWIGPLHFVVLDCDDATRRARLEARPAWRARDVDEQIAFGRWLRTHLAPVVDTGRGTPSDTAAEVAGKVRPYVEAQPEAMT